MAWFSRLFSRRTESPKDFEGILRLLLVEKLQAERDATVAQSEHQLRLLREKEELRQIRAEKARIRNRTLPRKNGKLQSPHSQEDCFICGHPGMTFTEDQLRAHRAHKPTPQPVLQ